MTAKKPLGSTDSNKQRVTLFVKPSILKQARAQAVVDEISLTSYVERALINFLPKETIIRKATLSSTPKR